MKAILNNRHSYTLLGESLPDVMRYIEKTPARWTPDSLVSRKTGGHYSLKSWDLGVGWSGTVDLCNTGWSEGGKAMRLVFNSLPRAHGAALETVYNPVKGHFSMGRYMTGNPNCFAREEHEEQDQAPIVTLAVNISASGATPADCLHNYGAAIAAGVEALELSDTRVAVNVYCVSTCGDRGSHRAVMGWNVKQAGQQLDMAALAFSIAHPASLRRVMFALLERTPSDFQAYGHGMPTDILPSDLPDADPNTVIINTSRQAHKLCTTPAKAVTAIEQAIKEGLPARA